MRQNSSMVLRLNSLILQRFDINIDFCPKVTLERVLIAKNVIYFTMKSMKDLKVLLYLLHVFLLNHLIKQGYVTVNCGKI